MTIKLNCKNCNKPLSYSEAPEARHWDEPIFNVERCNCLTLEDENQIEGFKNEIEGLNERFTRLITKIVELKSLELAEAALRINSITNKVPEVYFLLTPGGKVKT